LPIASLPIVLILQGIKILPGSGRTHTYRVDLASDSVQFLKKIIHNAALSAISSVPFFGNFVARDFIEAQKETAELMLRGLLNVQSPGYAVFADHFSPCPVNQGEIFLT
jgi:hypothetical protein